MSNELEIKIKDLIPAPELKDSAEYPISQEGVTYKVNHAQIEGKIVNKLGDRFVPMDQKGAANGIAPLDGNKKIPNENLTFGEVKEGDENVVSGGEVYGVFEQIAIIDQGYDPVNFTLERGTWSSIGTHDNSPNWIKTSKIQSDELTAYRVKGAESVPEGSILTIRRVFFFNKNIEFISSIGFNKSDFDFYTPTGAAYFSVVVAGAVDIGLNPSESIYNEKLKIFKSTEDAFYLKGSSIIGDIGTQQMLDIEFKLSEIGNFFYGYGAPNICNGSKSDTYIDVISGLKYVKSDFFWDVFNPQLNTKHDFPKVFFRNSLEYFRLKNKQKYIPYYNNSFIYNIVDLVKNTIKDFVYVDVNNGIDTNDGSKENPFKTIGKAMSGGYNNIWIKKGFYHRADNNVIRHNVNNQFLNIICENDVFISSCDKATDYSWVKEGNLWKSTRSGLGFVIDTSIYISNKQGHKHFTEVLTKQECVENIDTFFKDPNNTIYINTIEINDNIKLGLKGGFFELTMSNATEHFLLENANFYTCSDNAGIFVKSNTLNQSNCSVLIKNTYSYMNVLGDGIAIDNIKNVFIQNSGGFATKRDALNYHTSISSFEKMEALEIDCVSFDTGKYALNESSSNGSTAHDGMSIARFGGNFEIGRGSIVVDVNVGIKSINFDVTAIGSYLDKSASFHIQNGVGYYINCNAYDSEKAIIATGTSETAAHIDRDSVIIGDKEGNIIDIT